jgi:Ca2+-binding RTX toxin-like protein
MRRLLTITAALAVATVGIIGPVGGSEDEHLPRYDALAVPDSPLPFTVVEVPGPDDVNLDVMVDFGREFEAVAVVCVDVEFAGDPLDYAEILIFEWEDGQIWRDNSGDEPLSSAVACTTPWHEAMNDAAVDGSLEFTIDIEAGYEAASVTIATLAVTAIAVAGAADCDIAGTPHADVLLGTTGPDVICGFGGDDTIKGFGGDDLIIGGPGKDTLRGHAGDDILLGGPQGDGLFGGAGDDFLIGGGGWDDLMGHGGADWLRGGHHRDRILGGDGPDWIATGTGPGDVAYGGADRDYLFGGPDRDRLYGGDGDDWISAEGGNDGLFGGDGSDWLYGGAGDDWLCGQRGDDTVRDDEGDNGFCPVG